ncbi:hypothetical protein D3C72_767030 [compost metagenome]
MVRAAGIVHGGFLACAHVMRHPHIHHAQQLHAVQRGYVRLHAGARRQRGAGVPRTVHGLREDGVGTLVFGFDDHVIRFRHANAEFLYVHRSHVLPVGGHHRHLQAGNAHIEVGHRRAVDEAQPDAFARLEQPRPVAGGRGAVGQEGVGGAGHVRQVRRVHAHLLPHQPFGQRGAPAVFARVGRQALDAGLDAVVVVGHHLELVEEPHGVFVRPVGQQHGVLAVEGDGVVVARVDDDGAVQAGLFLKARVAVIPVGAALAHGETVGERLAGVDAVKAQAWHAVHVGRQKNAVPMNGRLFAQPVRDVQRDRVAFLPAQYGRG